MWRNYVICVLIGLLIATSLSSLTLLRQSQTTQSQTDQLHQRAVAAEATSASLQQQVNGLKGATPDTGNAIVTPASDGAATPTGGNAIVTPVAGNPRAGATPTPQSVAIAPVAPRPTTAAAPAPTVTSADSPVIQQIESDVVNLRGLQPKH